MTQISIPTTDDIRAAVRDELASFFANYKPNYSDEQDEIGKGAEFASKVTGKAVPTIYALVSRNEIPYSKPAGTLYFSRRELEEWMKSGRRTTRGEAAEIARSRPAFA